MRLSIPSRIVLAAALVQAAGCAHMAPTGSSDLVVVGQIDTLDAEAMDEWGLSVRYTGRLRVSRVLSKTPPSSVLPVRYIAHSAHASDRETQFHLRRSQDGAWLICSQGGDRGYICR